jgi:4-hydroxybenzoate polyprenyltransferase
MIHSPAGELGLRARRILSCIRYRDVLVLQGTPLLGAAFAAGKANVLLVAHIFTLNDWAGASADLNDPHRAAGALALAAKGVRRQEIGALSLVLLALSFLLFGLLGARATAIASAIVVLSMAYSMPGLQAKGVPLLGTALHLAGGVLHFLLGYALFGPIDRHAVAVAAFFALAFSAGHLNQEVRDRVGDRANGIRTNAVVFGAPATFLASLLVFTAAYADGFVLALRGTFPRALVVLAALYPFHLLWSLETLAAGLTFDGVRRLQGRYRALFAVAGVTMLAALLLAR